MEIGVCLLCPTCRVLCFIYRKWVLKMVSKQTTTCFCPIKLIEIYKYVIQLHNAF